MTEESKASTQADRSRAARFVDFIVERPWRSLLIAVGVLAVFIPGMSMITTNFTHTAFFKESDHLLQRFNAFEAKFGNDDAIIVVVRSENGVFREDTAPLLQELTAYMYLIHDVIRVDSLANYKWVHTNDAGDLDPEPLLPEWILDTEATDANEKAYGKEWTDQPREWQICISGIKHDDSRKCGPVYMAPSEQTEVNAAFLAEREKIALRHEVVPDYLISQDGKTALLYARVKPGFETPSDAQKITIETRDLIKQLKQKYGDHHEFHLSGGVAINTAFKESSERDMQTLMPIVLLITVLILLFRFRRLKGVFLPLGVVVFSIIGALAFSGYAGLELSTITITIPQILIAIGIADAVHILTSYYLSRRRGDDRKAATRYTLRKNLQPTILTSVSTALGFASFTTASLMPIVGLGLIAAVGTIVAWLFTYFFMGALLSLLPWKIKATEAQLGRLGEKRNDEPAIAKPAPSAVTYTRGLKRYAPWIVIATATITIGGTVLALQNKVNSDPYKYFSEDFPLRKSNEFLLREVGVANFELAIHSNKKPTKINDISFETIREGWIRVNIQSDAQGGAKEYDFLKKVEKFETDVVKLEGIKKAVSIVEVLRQTHRAYFDDNPAHYNLPVPKEGRPNPIAGLLLMYRQGLPQGADVDNLIDADENSIRVTLIGNITESTKWMDTRDQIEQLGKGIGIDVEVTGKILLYQGMNDHVVESFIRSVVTALILISLLLIIVFRSFRIGLLALLPNVIPLLIGGLILWALGKDVDIGTVLVASVCLGIAVDDTIHVLSNYNSMRKRGVSRDEAVANILTFTGPALIMTTAVLVAAFGTFAFATFIPNVYFGILTASILLTALIIDLTFLPAVLLLGKNRDKNKTTESKG